MFNFQRVITIPKNKCSIFDSAIRRFIDNAPTLLLILIDLFKLVVMLLESSTMTMKLTLAVLYFYFAYANACSSNKDPIRHRPWRPFPRPFPRSIDVKAGEVRDRMYDYIIT